LTPAQDERIVLPISRQRHQEIEMQRKARTPEGQALIAAMRERREAREAARASKAAVREARVAKYRAMMDDISSKKA
jgi:hypothetical protein